MPLEVELGIGVHRDLHGLPRTYPGELGFLEIGGHPNLGRNNRKDLLAGGDVIAHLDIAFGDPAVLRRRHDRPGKV